MTVSTAVLQLLAVASIQGLSTRGALRVLSAGWLTLIDHHELARSCHDGRGHDSAVMTWMPAKKPHELIPVSGDHAFRQSTRLEYFSEHAGLPQRIAFFSADKLDRAATFLRPDLDRRWNAPGRIPRRPAENGTSQAHRLRRHGGMADCDVKRCLLRRHTLLQRGQNQGVPP